MEVNNYISLSEYAELHGVTADTIRQRVLRGRHTTAIKVGRNWIIDKNEPFTDKRKKEEEKE